MRDKTREAMRLFLGGRCYTAEKLEKDYLAEVANYSNDRWEAPQRASRLAASVKRYKTSEMLRFIFATIAYDPDPDLSGNWRSLPSGLMYRLSELSVLSYEAVVCVDNVFVEDTPYGGAGEYSLHKNAAMLGVKALRLSRELRMLCGLPLHGLSDTLSPTRLVLLKARGKTLQKEYEMVKKSKKTEQEIEDFIKGTS